MQYGYGADSSEIYMDTTAAAYEEIDPVRTNIWSNFSNASKWFISKLTSMQ